MSDVTNIKTKRDDERWEVEISGEVTPDALAKFREHAIRDIGKSAQIKGFRPGHVPEETLVRHYGEDAILRAAAEDAIKHVLPEVIAKERANIVDAPQVSIGTPEAGKPLSFTARAPLAPEVMLPDYKTIVKEINAQKEPVTVSDDEHNDTLTHLRRERARTDKIEAGTQHDKAGEESRAMEEKDLPALDDAFVKTIGYDTLDVFTQKLREHLKNEKELRAKNEHRTKVIDALEKKTKIHMPAMLREYELDDMEGRFTDDLARMGKTFENYLTETKKTHEDVRKEWQNAAIARAHTRLILAHIAQKEKIEPNSSIVDQEFERAKKQYPQSSPDILRSNISHALRNEAVLEWLVNLS